MYNSLFATPNAVACVSRVTSITEASGRNIHKQPSKVCPEGSARGLMDSSHSRDANDCVGGWGGIRHNIVTDMESMWQPEALALLF